MFGMESLDVLIGLVTVYLTLALACTVIVEAIASWTGLRSKNLEAALTEFLSGQFDKDREFIHAFYDHPLIKSLSKGDKGRPSYIPPSIVGQTVRYVLCELDPNAERLTDLVDKLPGDAKDNRIKGLLLALVTEESDDAKRFQEAVAKHFDAVMDRASGWVKRRQQMVSLLVSATLVCAANVDTFAIATSLSSSPELRAKMVAIANNRLAAGVTLPPSNTKDNQVQSDAKKKIADAQATNSPAAHGSATPEGTPKSSSTHTARSSSADSSIDQALKKSEQALKAVNQTKVALETSGLQFGWKEVPPHNEWITKAVGLLISIFAVALGAPFWFDVLKRFMQVRASGVSPREKK